MQTTPTANDIPVKTTESRSSSLTPKAALLRLNSFLLIGLATMQVCTAASIFQNVMGRYKDIGSIVALENWGPPVFGIALGLGFVTVHMVSLVPQRLHRSLGIAIFSVWIIEALVIPAILFFANSEGLTKDFAFIVSALMMAGGLLRVAAFPPGFRWLDFMQTGQVS